MDVFAARGISATKRRTPRAAGASAERRIRPAVEPTGEPRAGAPAGRRSVAQRSRRAIGCGRAPVGFQSPESLAVDPRGMARGATRRRARDLRGRSALDHRRERQPGRRLPLQRQPVPRMFSFVCLLLCTPDAPVPRMGRRHRLRPQDRREGQRPGAAAARASAPVLEGRDDRLLRRHRLLPADRGRLRADAALPGDLRRVPQPGRDRHEGRAHPAGPRSARRDGPGDGRRRLHQPGLRRRLRRKGHRAQRLCALAALRDDRRPRRRRHPDRHRGGARHSGPQRQRHPGPAVAGAGGRRVRGFPHAAAAARRDSAGVRRAFDRGLPGPGRQDLVEPGADARWAPQRLPVRLTNGRRRPPLGGDRAPLRGRVPAPRPEPGPRRAGRAHEHLPPAGAGPGEPVRRRLEAVHFVSQST